MRLDVRTYCVAYCRRGHQYLGSDPPEGWRTKCGSEYVGRCQHCDTAVARRFESVAYLTTGAPVSVPVRPTFCDKCGKAFPWGRWHLRVLHASRNACVKVWQGFKGLSKTHLMVIVAIVVVVLLIVGALTIDDIKALLRK